MKTPDGKDTNVPSKTLEEIKEILDKMQFFGGQRAGRELWMDKPKDIQDADIESFNKDINNIRSYIQQLERENKELKAKLSADWREQHG